VPAIAHADPRDDAKAKYREGKVHYDLHEYDQAIARFKEAYRLFDDPVYLFNIAQAYRLAGDCPNAVAYYKSFLRGAPPEQHGKVRETLDELEPCPAPARDPEPEPDPEPPPPPAPTTTRTGRPALRLGGVISAGAGVLAGAVAIVFAWRSRDAADQVDAARGEDPFEWTPALEALDARGRRDETLAIAFGIGGAASVVAGGVLYVLGRDRERLVVTPTSGGATAELRWTF
jgi:tetratricopeptide (TPR) repeat protein